MKPILSSYANLLVNYCIYVQKGEKVLIRSTTLAEDLLKEVHDEILKAGGHPHFEISIQGTDESFYHFAEEHQMNYVNELSSYAISNFDCLLVIRAPFNLKSTSAISGEKLNQRSKANQSINEIYFQRTGNGELKRSLCQYPTQASAQEAGMSLSTYQQFVYNACGLFEEDPISYWQAVGKRQQKIVDYLMTKETIRYVTRGTDITFSTKGRTWINSDGKNNMPSGEVFTAPVEDSVNGEITFSYPSIYRGQEIEQVHLVVKNGYIESWSAQKGQEILDQVFKIEGARRFGEAAIGTNYQIQRITKNILFDEKIGGSIHMAVGQSYKQCGGKNKSSIHWDLITDMKEEGKIYADDELCYEKGMFIIDSLHTQ